MAEFDLGVVRYRTHLLNAIDQWRLLGQLQPLLPSLWTLEGGLRPGADMNDVLTSLKPLMASGDDVVRFVFRTCLSACERLAGEGWVPVEEPPAFDDLMKLVMAVAAENFGVFFTMQRPKYKPIMFDGVRYTPASLPDNDDWLFRPVTSMPPLCTLRELKDGTYHIEDVALMNDLLDLQEENRRRIDREARAKHV